MTTLFISDLHLDESRPLVVEAFRSFLKTQALESDRLFILGDLFEVWLGDDHDTPFNQNILSALAEYPGQGYIMHGNRDFLLGEDFCNGTGFTLLPDPTVMSVEGLDLLLMHGDSLCTRDTQYMAVRKMLRTPEAQADLLSRSLEERTAIAGNARSESSEHKRETAMDIMDVTGDEVVTAMSTAGVDLLIHGHTHRPDVHTVPLPDSEGKRVVLGDWDTLGWFVRMTNGDYELASFNIGIPE